METSETRVPQQNEIDCTDESLDNDLDQLLEQYYIDLAHERQKVLLDI